MKNRTIKLALLAGLSYSVFISDLSAETFSGYGTWDVADTFAAIPATERAGRAAAWLGRHKNDGTIVNSAGLRAYANAVPTALLALARKDGAQLKATVDGLTLSDADKAFAKAELAKGLNLSIDTDLDTKLTDFSAAIDDSSKTAAALDVLQTLGLFGKMRKALEVWNTESTGYITTSIQAYLNNITLMLLYMINGNGDAAKSMAEAQPSFSAAEETLWNIFIGYVKKDEENVPLLNQITNADLKILATNFVNTFQSAIAHPFVNSNAPVEEPPTPQPPQEGSDALNAAGSIVSPTFTTVDETDIALKIIEASLPGVTPQEVTDIVKNFSPDNEGPEQLAALQRTTFSDNEKKVLEFLSDNEPNYVAGLLFDYNDRKAGIGRGDNPIPEAVLEIVEKKPDVLASLIKKGGFIDVKTTAAAVDTSKIPAQIITRIKTRVSGTNAVAILKTLRETTGEGENLKLSGDLIDAVSEALGL